MEITLCVELVLFVILMGLSGFFSSAETSLFSLSKIQLEQLRRDGHASLNRIERLISTLCWLVGTRVRFNKITLCIPAWFGTCNRGSEGKMVRYRRIDSVPAMRQGFADE